jgi:2-polyprenyl-3-methyl-5-hydroxy-6-metoxy-1,4-benzoquinol methylase
MRVHRSRALMKRPRESGRALHRRRMWQPRDPMTPDRSDPWFEALYAGAGEDFEQIPWANLAPRPALVEWLDHNPPAPATKTLVIACGLGDDAEELARRGCDVDAFDLSSTAIATARRRFPDSTVRYRVADLFELPAEWRRRFEIVVEVQTIMSLPPEWHETAIAAVADTVAAGGHLWVRTAMRGEDELANTRPWPLTPSELRAFEEHGLEELSRCRDGIFAHIDYRNG